MDWQILTLRFKLFAIDVYRVFCKMYYYIRLAIEDYKIARLQKELKEIRERLAEAGFRKY